MLTRLSPAWFCCVAIALMSGLITGFVILVGVIAVSFGTLSREDLTASIGMMVLAGTVVSFFWAVAYVVQRDAGALSLSKRLLGVMAIDDRGRRCTTGASALRNFLLLFPMLPVIEGVVALARPDGRRLGDILASTSVVREHVSLFSEMLSTGEPERARQVVFWFLQAELPLPDKMSKRKVPRLLAVFPHIVKRQECLCDQLIRSEPIFDDKTSLIVYG